MTYERFEQDMRDFPPTESYKILNELPIDRGAVSRRYFPEHGATWLYDMLRGYTTDMKSRMPDFTPDERQRLKGALCDMADSLRRAAESL